MSLPTPQDFEKAKVKRWMLELAVDNTNHNEIIGAKLVPNEMGGWVMLEDYYRLESEKSLLEKRIEQIDKKYEEASDAVNHNLKICKRLEAENERLKAEVASIQNAPIQFRNKRIEELESRLAEAVGVLKIYAPDKCDNCDGEGLIESDGLNGSMMEYMCPCKVAREFLSSPTTSKALEIARAKEAVIEVAQEYCRKWREHETETIWIDMKMLKQRVEALDALTSEEGK